MMRRRITHTAINSFNSRMTMVYAERHRAGVVLLCSGAASVCLLRGGFASVCKTCNLLAVLHAFDLADLQVKIALISNQHCHVCVCTARLQQVGEHQTRSSCSDRLSALQHRSIQATVRGNAELTHLNCTSA